MPRMVKGAAAPHAEIEALHRAYVGAPFEEDDGTESSMSLLRLAKRFGIDAKSARQWAIFGEWYLEREANAALAWRAKHHRGAPLALEGFAAYYADKEYSHLERPRALAWGRSTWYRALAVVAHWESARIIAASRMARQRALRQAGREARPSPDDL